MVSEAVDRKARPLIDFAFTKTAEHPRTGDLELKGYASTWAVDRDNEVVAPDAFKNLDRYLTENPILLWQHDQNKPIGQVKDASLDGSGLIVVSRMPRPEPEEEGWAHTAYHKVQKGIVRTYSIGGKFKKLVEKGKAVKRIVGCELYEISVVSVPANPESLFEAAVKSVMGPLRPDLSPRVVGQMEQIVGMKAVTDPDLLEMTPAELTERYEELGDLYREAGKRTPEMSGWRDLAAKQAAMTDPAEVITLTPEITEQVRLVQGLIDVKYGRTFSRRNEEAILTAARGIVEHGNALVRILGKEEKDEDEDEDSDKDKEKAQAEKPQPEDSKDDGSKKSLDNDPEWVEGAVEWALDWKRRRHGHHGGGFDPSQPRDRVGRWRDEMSTVETAEMDTLSTALLDAFGGGGGGSRVATPAGPDDLAHLGPAWKPGEGADSPRITTARDGLHRLRTEAQLKRDRPGGEGARWATGLFDNTFDEVRDDEDAKQKALDALDLIDQARDATPDKWLDPRDTAEAMSMLEKIEKLLLQASK
jgi:HK97 family phage prohead protease